MRRWGWLKRVEPPDDASRPSGPPRRSPDSGRSATPQRHPVQISVGEHLDAIRPVLAAFNSRGESISPEQLQRAWAAYDELRRLFG